MHCGKQARRGYNQAQELAVLLGEELGWPYAGVLKRCRIRFPRPACRGSSGSDMPVKFMRRMKKG